VADPGNAIIQAKRASKARWEAFNPILKEGEIGYEKPYPGSSGKFKIGDGVTPWNDLPYFTPVQGEPAPNSLADHVNSQTPHPVYDNGPSLALLYSNAKV